MRRFSLTVAHIALVLIFAVSAACTIQVPMATKMPDLGMQNRIPLRATLVIPESVRGYKFEGKPESFTGGARPHVFPLGEELERATQAAFAQVFHEIRVVRHRPELKDIELLIEPEIASFHFRYDQLSYAGFAVAAVSRITVKVTMSDGSEVAWTRTAQSPEQRSGPWVVNLSPERNMGEAASAALTTTRKEIAEEAAKAAELWKLADKVRTERGTL